MQQGRQPDLTLWFDLPPQVAAERRAAARAPDRFEQQDTAFFERVREGYARAHGAGAAALRAPGCGRRTRCGVGADRTGAGAAAVVVGADGRLPLPWLEAPLRQALQQQRAMRCCCRRRRASARSSSCSTLAQAWLCEVGRRGARPCGRCGSCRLVQSRVAPRPAAAAARGPAPALGWAARPRTSRARAARRGASPAARSASTRCAPPSTGSRRRSSRGRGKVVVLHPAEAMNLQAASALLKTLEEPPGQAAPAAERGRPSALLPTVRSRCQRIRLAVPPAEQAAAWLAGAGRGAMPAGAAGRRRRRAAGRP